MTEDMQLAVEAEGNEAVQGPPLAGEGNHGEKGRRIGVAFKLSGEQRKRKAEIERRLRDAQEVMDHEGRSAITEIDEILGKVNAARAEYQTVLTEAREFVENVAEEMRSEYDEKSENWQEGDKASEVDRWISEWEGVDLTDVEDAELDLDALQEIGTDDCDTFEELAGESQ
jgi:hypothetical protein